jgi:hypothetical protein
MSVPLDRFQSWRSYQSVALKVQSSVRPEHGAQWIVLSVHLRETNCFPHAYIRLRVRLRHRVAHQRS